MRHLPLKILILCVLLPPLLYINSLSLLEKVLQIRYEKDLETALIGNVNPLLEGSAELQDVLQRNITVFIGSRKMTALGVKVSVTVTSTSGAYLYPHGYEDSQSEFRETDSLAIASENYRLLSDGLQRTLEVKIDHNALIANFLLSFYVLFSVGILFLVYRRGVEKSRADELATKKMIDELADEHRQHLSHLCTLETQRSELSKKIAQMKKALDDERQKASETEDEMVEELVALEDKISQHLALQNQQSQEIDALQEKIDQYEKEKASRQRQVQKSGDTVRKRFNALYKNIDVHDKAIDGFMNLTEELQIKAEETVHQLNGDPKMVPVKRKVFGKKNRETVFEVIFAYKGRLYYRTKPGRGVEVLVVGTKLTQNKDLAFLDKL
jgi:DNA repair exonuclease SbcCD ATPase subunit